MSNSHESQAFLPLWRALAEVGLEVAREAGGADGRADLVIRGPHGIGVAIEVLRRALVRDLDVPELIRGLRATHARRGVIGVVVADRITEGAKKRLRANSWGWLDLRGDLHLEAPGVFIDARVSPTEAPTQVIKEPLVGAVGLELASLLLMQPTRCYRVREAATELERAPSSVSQELGRLRHAGLVDQEHRPVSPDLFEAVSQRWRPESIDVATMPGHGSTAINDALRLGLDEYEYQSGWALGDTLAAIAYGAPLSASGSYPPDLYVPDRATLRRAVQLLGVAPTHVQRAATLRVAPVPLVTARRVEGPASQGGSWPLVHPVFAALDLARDADRGAEVLAKWDPPAEWQRVW